MEQQGDPGHYQDVVRSILADAGSAAIGKIELIKRLREATGLGLKDAKEAVDEYYRVDGFCPWVPAKEAPTFASDGDPDVAVERALADSGRSPVSKSELIKRVREATGLGLKDAKEAVESYSQRHPGTRPQASRPGCGGGTALLLLAVGAMLAELWR